MAEKLLENGETESDSSSGSSDDDNTLKRQPVDQSPYTPPLPPKKRSSSFSVTTPAGLLSPELPSPSQRFDFANRPLPETPAPGPRNIKRSQTVHSPVVTRKTPAAAVYQKPSELAAQITSVSAAPPLLSPKLPKPPLLPAKPSPTADKPPVPAMRRGRKNSAESTPPPLPQRSFRARTKLLTDEDEMAG